MSRPSFSLIAERLREPLLLLSLGGEVVAANAAARSELGVDLTTGELADKCDDPERFRHYLSLASRSTSPSPGAVSFPGSGRWRCDASLIEPRDEDKHRLLLHLREPTGASSHFHGLNRQVEKLHAEIRRREVLEAERSELLERERHARLEAQEASRLKDEFLASVSHELRTPLHAIVGWVAMLREDALGDTQRRGLDVIERSVEFQTRLVEDLLDLSQASSGQMKLDIGLVEVAAIAESAVESIRPLADRRHQHIEVEVTATRSKVNGDALRLRQVMWNLLSNAIKYSVEGGEIGVVVRESGTNVEVAVSDRGAGIEQSLIGHIFDRFRRGDGSSTRTTPGLGLGLTIAQHLVEMHGGSMTATSDGIGHGSTFTVALPLAAVEDDERRTEATTRPRLDELTILLVEDHDDSRELMAMILENRGATVVAVESPVAAREALDHLSPDLIISDIEMPNEDGFTFIETLRATEKARGLTLIPAIAVTAHSFGRGRALRAGFQSFLSKPVGAESLVGVVARVMSVARAAREQAAR